uniref:(northern house mosquito) hypothetical protein n=1 Tax=Culex pipiens TaxID=7175 RepID=A0A8D8CT11_CULPI
MVNGDTWSHTPATPWWHFPRPQRRHPTATQLAHASPHWRHLDPHTVETKSATTVASQHKKQETSACKQFGRADGAADHGGRHQGRWHSSGAAPKPQTTTPR